MGFSWLCESRFRICFLLMFLSMPLLGCGSKEPEPTGPQATVSGTITFAEEPIPAGSSVVFFCQEQSATASGIIDDQGKYVLSPAMRSVGIPVGKYQVMIRPPELPQPVVGTKEYEDSMTGKTKKPDPPKEIPAQFHALSTSGIVVEMKAGTNNFDFDLAKLEKKQ